jgi:hypothetical protein
MKARLADMEAEFLPISLYSPIALALALAL